MVSHQKRGKGQKENESAGARTLDLRIKSPLLYQLSYALFPQKRKENNTIREVDYNPTDGSVFHSSLLSFVRNRPLCEELFDSYPYLTHTRGERFTDLIHGFGLSSSRSLVLTRSLFSSNTVSQASLKPNQ